MGHEVQLSSTLTQARLRVFAKTITKGEVNDFLKEKNTGKKHELNCFSMNIIEAG